MTTETSQQPAPTHERHASWMELFFDLVAVAGVLQLTHLLHDGPTLGDFGLYVLLYLAFWMVWAVIMLYGNIARDRTNVPLMLAAMLGLGVLAAAVAGLPERHATAFAAVYVVLRIASGGLWGRGKVVVDWPIVEMGAGTLPWVVSLWVPEPWKYWCWALGLAMDMLIMFFVRGDRLLAGMQEQFERRLNRIRRVREIDETQVPKIEALHADPAHLGERLGLYVLIVLGEGVIAVISAVGAEAWTAQILVLGFGAFVILAGLWALTLIYGGVVARLLGGSVPETVLSRQHVMVMHCFLTGAIATIAAGLGLAIGHASGHLTAGIGWTLCGGAAAYFAINAFVGLWSPPGWRWSLSWPVPCAVLAVTLGIFAPHLGALGAVGGLAALILWPVLWEYRTERRLRQAAVDKEQDGGDAR
ncbi:low temperature requirement protein A [Nocardia sp. NPDC050712]|uniref:low temperature requirement protein A n=1 Tax=Nocardia sp. NPDC050712 TaxID=3155518 RepID=UPI0033E3D485